MGYINVQGSLGHFLLQLSRPVVFKTHNHLGDANAEHKSEVFDVPQESVDMLTMRSDTDL